MEQVMTMHHAAAPKADYRQPVFARTLAASGPVDQRRLVMNNSLHHTDLVPQVGEVSAVVVEWQGIKHEFSTERLHLDLWDTNVDEQRVVDL
jgi:hypothetical protein